MNYIKLFLGILAISVVAFSGCKKKKLEKARNSVKEKLTGTWKMTKVGTDQNGDGVMDDNEMTAVSDSLFSTTVTFAADGSGNSAIHVSTFDLPTSFTWAVNGDNNGFDVTSSSTFNLVFGVNKGHVLIDELTGTELITKEVATSPAPVTAWSVFVKQ